MSIEDELRIYEYLDKVSDAVTGRLGPQERSDLVDAVRHRIDRDRQLAPVRRRREVDVERILQQLGPPEVLAERMLQGSPQTETAVPAAAPAPGHAPVDEPADGTTAPQTAEPPSRERPTRVRRIAAMRRRRRIDRQEGSLTQRARTAAGRLWPSVPRSDDTPLDPTMVVRAYALEIGALLTYTIGTIVVSYVGFILAAILTLFSRIWSEREKGVAIALIPAVMLGIGMLVVWVDEGRDRSGTTAERWDRVSAALGDLFMMLPLVSGFLSAIYLLYRLLIIARP